MTIMVIALFVANLTFLSFSLPGENQQIFHIISESDIFPSYQKIFNTEKGEIIMKKKKRFSFTAIVASVMVSVIIGISAPAMQMHASPKAMSDGGVFDAAYYAQQNPDVASAIGTDEETLYLHYKLYGEKEGRLPYDPKSPETAEIKNDEAVASGISAIKAQYPEGMHWTNEDMYIPKYAHVRAYGCAGFAYICSDTIYGENAPYKAYQNINQIRVGDIVHLDNGEHYVFVIGKDANGIVAAEGNYNRSIHYGRYIPNSTMGFTDGVTRR